MTESSAVTSTSGAFADPETYWRAEDTWTPPAALWVDPFPEFTGMLSSDLILAYQAALDNRFIAPFDKDNLKPAAYELTLGPVYYVNGVRRVLDHDDPWLTIPRNSIVFVSMQERLVIPHYIAARFDLAIEFIYQGILLGTGPQVDPGFQGVLGCPLHNISDGDVSLRYGYPFAKIDFAKTSGLVKADTKKIANERDLYDAELVGFGSEPVKLFNVKNRWREPIFDSDYTGRREISSSLAGLEDDIRRFGGDIDGFEQEVGRFRRFGLAGALAVVFAMVSILVAVTQLDRSYTDSKTEGSQTVETQQTQDIELLQSKIASLEQTVARLEGQLSVRKRP
jgi:deoxycytidine triphosphate deaminase